MSLIVPIVLLLLLTPLVIGIMRINELFALQLHQGRLVRRRGRIPRRLLSDLQDVLTRGGVRSAKLRGVVEDGRAAIYIEGQGVTAGVRQQLRNTISLWPLAKIRNAAK